MVDIVCANTVTALGPEHRGQVLIGGSHGGVYAGYLAAKAGVRAVILHNAGIGKDEAGIGSLAYLDQFGLPVAALDHMSARIADGYDQLARAPSAMSTKPPPRSAANRGKIAALLPS